MMLRWIWCLVLLLLIEFSTAAKNVANGIPPPSFVKMYTVNGNSFINWTYPGYNISGRVTFEVAAKDNWETNWITQCNQTERNSCDIVSPIFTLDKKCARHNADYDGRVRACVPIQDRTINCSAWVVKKIDVPLADQFSAPDFKIDGIYHETQLRLSNRPFVVRHSNISVNCYYQDSLKYKILYWVGNDKNNTIQDESTSFDMKTISLRLAYAPRQHTQICVQMAIINGFTKIRHPWKVQCIQYTPSPDESSKYAAIAIGIAMVLLVIFIAVRLFKLFRSKFSGKKFILPSDLNELMNDILVDPENTETQIISESAHMICLDLADEKYDSSAEITPSQDSISMHPESQEGMNCQKPFGFTVSERINHADSIPYIADAEAAAFSPSQNGNSGGIIINNGVARSYIEDPGRYLTAICQEGKTRNSSSMPLPNFPLTIEQLARARLFSSSMGDLASQQWDFAVMERRTLSTDNILKSNLNEYCKTSEYSRECQQKPEMCMPELRGKPPISCRKTLASDATESFSKYQLATVKAVCIENPTYSPNPGLFDFLDQTFYCAVNSSKKIYDGLPGARTFAKRSNSAGNCGSLYDRRVKSYGKRFHLNTCEDNNFQSVKFFIPGNDTFDDRLYRSQSNLCLGKPSPSLSKRTRIASDADSGYHVENSSVSDASFMSPPVSPDEKFYPDVFPAGCSKVSAHPFCSNLHNAKLHQSAYSLEDDGVSYEEESPYVTEEYLNQSLYRGFA